MNIPVKTIKGENGELLMTIEGRRYSVAKCRPTIRIYENSHKINVLGSISCQTKTTHIAIVICVDREIADNIDFTRWENATGFELMGDFERKDGVYESINLKNITPIPQDLNGEMWEFEISGQSDIIEKLVVL